MNCRLHTIAALAIGLTLATAKARAQEYDAEVQEAVESDPAYRPSTLSGMLHIPWYYGFGVGAVLRYEIPVAPAGLVKGVNDQISIEPSFGLAYSSYSYGSSLYDDFSFLYLTPAAYGIWSFYLQEQLRIYGGLGLGYGVGIVSGRSLYGATLNHFYWDFVAGLFYQFTDHVALRAELGYEGPKVGLSLVL